MPTPVIVYSKPACVQCTATYRALDRAGIAYEVIDVTADPAALAACVAIGYRAAPVVVAGDESWSGFDPDRIAALARRIAA